MVVSLGTVLWVANGVGGGGPRLAFFYHRTFFEVWSDQWTVA